MEFRRQRAQSSRDLPVDGVSAPPSRWTTLPRVVALTALLCCTIAPAVSAQVTVLVESRASIYQQAAQGFQQAFSSTDPVQRLYLNGDNRALEASFASLRNNPPRLVVAIGTQAARIAKARLPANTPILYCLALQPDQNELVGANIGGIALDVDLSQQFEKIQQALPNLRRIGVVYNKLTSGSIVMQASRYLKAGVTLEERQVNTPQEAARKIEELMTSVLSTQDAFWLVWDSVTANTANFRRLVELSLTYRVPLIAPARPFVEAGALISVGANYEQAGRQAAAMAQRVLRSEAQPGDFAAVRPLVAVVTINGGVAQRLGITIPPELPAEVLAPAAGARAP